MVKTKAEIPKITYSFWNGVPFELKEGQILAFDTETDCFEDDLTKPQRIALWTASDGERTVIGHPSQLVKFVRDHELTQIVGQNISFDFWVVLRHLEALKDEKAIKLWWKKLDVGHFHDTMILDALIRLAQGAGEFGDADDDGFYMRGLGDIAASWLNVLIDKSDPYRKRYHEIIGKAFKDVKEEGFFSYAAKDAWVTARLYPPMKRVAEDFAFRMSRYLPGDSTKRLKNWLSYGLLTEQIQIKAAVALDQIRRLGLPYCPFRAAEDEKKWRDKINDLIVELDKLRPNFFKKKNGRFQLSKKALVPGINAVDLTAALGDAACKVKEALPDFSTPQSDGKHGGISHAAVDWSVYVKYDRFLELWCPFTEVQKRLGFYAIFRKPSSNLFTEMEPEKDDALRPRINLLMRTGRTSYGSPNCQQFPRDEHFRGIFKARPGYRMLTIDYSAIELRTLAAICKDRFGFSVLGDVIAKGIDPHAYTASAIVGIPFEEFMSWKTTNKDKYKEYRQKAKPVNFGYPGGLGAEKFVAFAAAQYGTIFTLKEAEDFKAKLIYEIYPELSDKDGYLADDTLRSIAINSGLTLSEVESSLNVVSETREWIGRVISRMASGHTVKANGQPYNAVFYKNVWDGLSRLGALAPIKGPLSDAARRRLRLQSGDPSLERELCLGHAVTLTGRIRGKVAYTKLKNTGFQGLASDGAKMALYRLIREGYRVLAFVHDEAVIEVPEKGDEEHAKNVEKIMCEEMEKVLGGVIPIETEWRLGDCWAK